MDYVKVKDESRGTRETSSNFLFFSPIVQRVLQMQYRERVPGEEARGESARRSEDADRNLRRGAPSPTHADSLCEFRDSVGVKHTLGAGIGIILNRTAGIEP